MFSTRKLARCFVTSCFVAAVFSVTASQVRAEILVDLYFNDSSSAGSAPDHADYGWKFVLSQAKYVTALGFWDDAGDGLTEAHQVGLYNEDGTSLLAQTTVNNGSTPVASGETTGRWLFQSLGSGVLLNPGTYVLSADYPNAGFDAWRYAANSLNMAPGTFFAGARYSSSASPGLQFPDLDDVNNSYFGPNAMFSAVPEPSSMLLVGLLTAGGGLRTLRRKWAGRKSHAEVAA